MKVEFSVLISVYKQENPDYFDQALKSVYFDQTLKPSEIVLVRDGMLTPDLELVIKKYKTLLKEKLIVVGYSSNKGLGFALNYGLKNCRNEIVARFDTDDLCIPERFKIQLKVFDQNPELAIVGSYINEFYEIPGDLNQLRKVPLRSKQIQKNKNLKNPFNHMTVGFRKSIIEEVGGYIDMPGYEDYYLWLRVLKKYNGLNYHKPLVFARIGNNMIKRRQGIEFLKKEVLFQNRLLKDGLISLPIYVRNIFLRVTPRILPVFALELIYFKFLRGIK